MTYFLPAQHVVPHGAAAEVDVEVGVRLRHAHQKEHGHARLAFHVLVGELVRQAPTLVRYRVELCTNSRDYINFDKEKNLNEYKFIF